MAPAAPSDAIMAALTKLPTPPQRRSGAVATVGGRCLNLSPSLTCVTVNGHLSPNTVDPPASVMGRIGWDVKQQSAAACERARAIRKALGDRSLVMVGLMGCGKTSVGRRLSARLDLPFVDADEEIEAAAGKSISEIFADHGEAHFRDGERKVIARLLKNGPQVLATGGGAFMNPETRQNIKLAGISIWLKADLPVLMRRVMRRDNRPLLKTADPEARMRELMN